MYKNILIFLQQYWIITRPLDTMKNNSLKIESFLKNAIPAKIIKENITWSKECTA